MNKPATKRCGEFSPWLVAVLHMAESVKYRKKEIRKIACLHNFWTKETTRETLRNNVLCSERKSGNFLIRSSLLLLALS